MTIPLELGPSRFTPSTSTAPESGRSKPAMIFISVDFPQPDGPTIASVVPSGTSKLIPPTTSRRPLSVLKPFLMSCTETFGVRSAVSIMRASSFGAIFPPHRLQPLEQSHQAVEHQADEADDDHAGDDEIVAIARVARVHDHVAETRSQRDHLRGDDHQPRDTDPDAHADD